MIKHESEISHNKTDKAGLEGARITTIDRAGARGKKGQAPKHRKVKIAVNAESLRSATRSGLPMGLCLWESR